jgi:RNA polymerase sigma-70 factor (ECF subfamily)
MDHARELERVFRDEWGRVLATLIGFLGDFDLAEEATQEALTLAAERWPRDGWPVKPGSWLTTTARTIPLSGAHHDPATPDKGVAAGAAVTEINRRWR